MTNDSSEDKAPLVPDHELLRRIGGGSYGEVWLARSVIGTYRAIKVVYRQTFDDERPYEREFTGMKKFEPISRTHEGLVDILQVGRNDQAGYYYYIMELADDLASGQHITPETYDPKTLGKELANRGRLPFRECLNFSLSVCDALGHLHKHGLIHRDIKPSNIIFVNGIPKIADIGLVTDVGSSHSYVGTEGFMPPEGPGTALGDIYSLGKVLYEIATGKDRTRYPELPTQVAEMPDRKDWLELNEVIVRACEDDVHKRYQSAEEMHADVVLLLAGKSVKRLRVLERRLAWFSKAALAVFVLMLVGAGIYYQVNRERKYAAEERKRAAEARLRQIGSFVAYGTGAIDEGDYLGSLASLVEALRLDENNPARARTHRARIGAVVRQSPRIVQMWFQDRPVYRAQFSPDGSKLLLAGAEHVRFCDLVSGELSSALFGTPKGHQKAWLSKDGQLVVTAGGGATARIWDTVSGNELPSFTHSFHLHCAQLSADGQLLVAASSDANVFVRDRMTGEAVYTFRGHTNDGHTGEVLYAAFRPDGRYVVSTSRDGTARVWETRTGKPLVAPLKHKRGDWVYYAGFSPNGRYVATASSDRTARLWDTESGGEVFPPLRHNDAVESVEFSPDGKYVLTASLDFTVRLWDATTGKSVDPPLPHSGRVMHAAFSPDGKRVVSACWDGTVRVWNVEPMLFLPPAMRVTFSPDGRKFATISNARGEVHDAGSGATLCRFSPSSTTATESLFCGDGNRLAVITRITNATGMVKRQVQLWDSATGQPFGRPFQYDSLSDVALAPDGRRLASFGRRQLIVWDTLTGNPLFADAAFHGTVKRAQFDSTGKYLATASGNVAQVWNAETGAAVTLPLAHPAEVSHVVFSPDGLLLLTTCAEGFFDELAAQIWDVRTGERAGPPLRHRDGVLHAAFSPDGKRVVTAGEDFSAMIWDAKSGNQLTLRPLKHDNQVWHVCFSADGQWVLTAGRDGVARVWDATTGEPVTPPLRHPSGLDSAQFVAHDRRVVTKTSDGQMRAWEIPVETKPVEDLALVAQLLSAQHYHPSGAIVPQTKNDLRECWEALRAKYPDEFAVKR